MKKLKLIVSTILLLLIMGITLAQTNIVFAATTNSVSSGNVKPLYFTLSKVFSDGWGYKNIHNKKIYDVKVYDSNGILQNLGAYCLTADLSYTWNNGVGFSGVESEKIEYTNYYDLENEKEIIVANHPGHATISKLINGGYYEEIIWILNNIYVPGNSTDSQKNELYKNAGIGAYGKQEPYTVELTDSDIEAVNQAALWYYTNYKLEYNKENNNDHLNYDKNNSVEGTAFLYYSILDSNNILSDNYKSLEDYTTPENMYEGVQRNEQAKKLFEYLISTAEKEANTYVGGKPIQVVADESKEVYGEVKSEKTVIGPITINKKSDVGYELGLSVTSESGKNIDYTITDETGKTILTLNGNKITKTQLESIMVDNKAEFYITTSSNKATRTNIKFDITYNKKVLWLPSGENANVEQPIVILEKTSDNVELYSEPVEKQFDLKLIKYITQVNSQNLSTEDMRTEDGSFDGVISIDSSKLKDKTATTAKYKLLKNPVLVDYGDLIIYTIRVYNEGDISGYASEISENIPSGLEFIEDNEINKKYGWVVDENGIAKTTYLAKSDAQDNLIPAYDINNDDGKGSGLAYKYVQIALKVSKTADINSIIRNEAAITEDADFNGNEISDRDSDTENWEKKDSKEYYDEVNNKWPIYEEDDEDYDNVRLKVLDLALRKYITKVNEVTVAPRVPEVDTTNLYKLDINGNYIDTTADYKHRKDPVEIENGDTVIYNITIYNEGNKTGFAKQIIDQLPTGLLYSGISTTVTATRTSGTGNTYQVSYDEKTNQVKLVATTENALNAYDGNLDYETVEIICKVNQRPDVKDEIILTNIAWIDLAYDSEKQVLIPGNELGIKDADSEPENHPTKSADELNTKNEIGYTGKEKYEENQLADSSKYYEGEQDDDDFEKLVLQPKIFDLALRKFITKVENKEYSREPVVDITNLYKEVDGKLVTTATYNHSKEPVYAQVGDKIIYTIRVYNEGEVDGYVGEITDYLPENLKFVTDSKTNKKYGWVYDEETRKVTTTYLSSVNGTENLLVAFDGEKLSYKDVQIECIIDSTAEVGKYLTNIAEITKYEYSDGTIINPDRDSTSDNLVYPEDVPGYKQDEIKKEYVPGQEDDDDFEKILVSQFDLALRKYITKVGTQEVNNRVPEITYENGKIVYTHTKEPVLVKKGDIVEYTLAIYNEGTLDGYASEITDYILKNEGLVYVNGHETNEKYGWKMYDAQGNVTEDLEKAVTIRTDYLSKESGEARMTEEDTENPNLLKAFDSNAEISDKNPDRRILKIAYSVADTTTSKDILVNIAEISDDTDKDGDEIDDIDSVPGSDEKNYPDNGYNSEDHEDDIDYEPVIVTEFDLALKKYVSQAIVIENGKETITETGHTGEENPEPVVKVELNRKDLSKVIVKFNYTIKITNEGDIEGYAKEITDYVPAGLKFIAEDNPGWTDEGDNVISTRLLENTLLKPGESATVKVLLTWINGEDNLGLKTNIAEISEDYNDKNVPDRDSTPDNKISGEDDIDDAQVILTVKTGSEVTYYAVIFVVLISIAGGILLIKKFVL